MAGASHHLNCALLDSKKPRVPPVYPSLGADDVMVVPQDSGCCYQRPRSPSLNTSFADLLLEDRPVLHQGREGRLTSDHLYSSSDTRAVDSATTIENLRDTIMALQLQNSELSICLQQERRRREEAESSKEQDRRCINRLEENIQVC